MQTTLEKKRVGLFLPDGIGIKNYLFSKLPREIIKKGDSLVILHSISEQAIDEAKRTINVEFESYKVPGYKEGVVEKFFRETATLSRLKFNVRITGNSTILLNWNKKPVGLFQKLFYAIARLLSTPIAKSYRAILFLESQYYKTIKRNQEYYGLVDFLKGKNLNSILCSHQRAIIAAPLFEAAKEIHIKSFTVIYSWDNLPKARMILSSDIYMVWSEYMKMELHLYYPHIQIDHVIVTGSPQFEFYRNADYIYSKEEFCSKYDLDPNRKIICFSGNDTTSPYDPEFLRDLCESITSVPRKLQPQLLLRRNPIDEGSRFVWILKSFPKIVKEIEPLWAFTEEKSNWALAYPSIQDIVLLVNIAKHSDAVVNVGSTMAHDFAMFNKPVYYLNYIPQHDFRSLFNRFYKNWSNEIIYRFQHFRSMPEKSPVHWINSKNDFIKLLSDLETHSNSTSDAQEEWLDIVVGKNNIEKASSNIAQLLLQ